VQLPSSGSKSKTKEAVGYSGNVSDLYSGDDKFESQPEQLSLLRFSWHSSVRPGKFLES
jgi:hypothetical protein